MDKVKAEEAQKELTMILLYLSRFTSNDRLVKSDDVYSWKGYDFNKVKVFYFTDEKEMMVATRFCNDLVSVFSGKTKKQDIEKTIEQITDTGIQKILTNYLNANLEQIEYAFSAEGLDKMNENISTYNNGICSILNLKICHRH